LWKTCFIIGQNLSILFFMCGQIAYTYCNILVAFKIVVTEIGSPKFCGTFPVTKVEIGMRKFRTPKGARRKGKSRRERLILDVSPTPSFK